MFFNKIKKLLSFLCILLLFFQATIPVYASMLDEAEARKSLPIESNAIAGWPQGPALGAESAILIDSDTGAILYEKNIHAKEFPASTTKVMTCLVAMENSSLDEMVTFSEEAVFGIERGSSNVGMDVGQQITMEDALYCIMLASANEVASAVAEHVGGSIDNFAEMMNAKAKELGCTETHFCNANGLHNDNHYTSAHDLALITRAFFQNETLSKIANTVSYDMHATATQPDEFTSYNHHKMLPGGDYEYEYIVGGKTGYTNVARQTLTTCAEKDGMRLICVIMKEESPNQFLDTIALFDYGFNNFVRMNIAENETNFSIDSANFFHTDCDIFGNSKSLLSINPTGSVILPKTATFSEATPTLTYDTSVKDAVASLSYTYQGVYVGSTTIDLADNSVSSFDFGDGVAVNPTVSSNDLAKKENVVFVNIRLVAMILLFVFLILLFLFVLKAFLRNYHFSKRRRSKIKKKRRRYFSEFDDYNF